MSSPAPPGREVSHAQQGTSHPKLPSVTEEPAPPLEASVVGPDALAARMLTPQQLLHLQRTVGNQAIGALMRQARPGALAAIPAAAPTTGQIQRSPGGEQSVIASDPAAPEPGQPMGIPMGIGVASEPREVLGPAVARLRRNLARGLPADPTDTAQRMLVVLPAVAAILDETLTLARSSAILDQSSPANPGYYGAAGVSGGDANALWDFYKARWESRDVRTRQRWLQRGRQRIAGLISRGAVARSIVSAFRARVNSDIDLLISGRITALRSDQNFVVLSRGGRRLERPEIIAAPPPRPPGLSSERRLTPEETGETVTVADPAAPPTAEEIEAARAEIQVEVVRQSAGRWINPAVLAPIHFAAGHTPSTRTTLFGPLIALLISEAAQNESIAAAEQQAARSARSAARGQGTAAEAAASTPAQPAAEDSALADLRRQQSALRAQIDEARATATAAALAWYQHHLAELPAGRAAEPRPDTSGRTPRPGLSLQIPAGVRRGYIERAIRELQGGNLLVDFQRRHYRGRVAGRSIDLPPARLGEKVDRPGGHVAGGPGYIEGLIEPRVRGNATLPAEYRELGVHAMQAWRSLEGPPQSINTWDSATLTAGSGIAARGRLQAALVGFARNDPQGFHALFGRFGIGVEGDTEISVQLPATLPENLVESDFTPGARLTGEDAIRYIAADPVLLIQFRRAGHARSWQGALVDSAIVSVTSALRRSFRDSTWPTIVAGLPGPLVEGALWAVADSIHAGGSIAARDGELQRAWRALGVPEGTAAASLPLEQRRALAVAAFRSRPANRRAAFTAVVPALVPLLQAPAPATSSPPASSAQPAP